MTDRIDAEIARLKDELASAKLALRVFTAAAFPCSTCIDKRGYKWSEVYLDQALARARSLSQKPAGVIAGSHVAPSREADSNGGECD